MMSSTYQSNCPEMHASNASAGRRKIPIIAFSEVDLNWLPWLIYLGIALGVLYILSKVNYHSRSILGRSPDNANFRDKRRDSGVRNHNPLALACVYALFFAAYPVAVILCLAFIFQP